MNKKLELHKAYDFSGSEQPELTLVFVHGIATDAMSFWEMLQFLEKSAVAPKIRMVAFDLLGAGKSPATDDLEYDFSEQLGALENSIKKLGLKQPFVMVGHSMGTIITTRYAKKHPEEVKEMILLSPPIYYPETLNDPLFALAVEKIKQVMQEKHPKVKDSKAFENEMNLIVLDPKNYSFFEKAEQPTTIIYGAEDQIIASFNIPQVLKNNKLVKAVKTNGGHSLTEDKFEPVLKVIERLLK